MALCRLSHLVVNDGQLGTNWLPIGPQSYPNRTTIVPRLVYDLVSTMAKMVISIVYNWLEKPPFQSKLIKILFLYIYPTWL